MGGFAAAGRGQASGVVVTVLPQPAAPARLRAELVRAGADLVAQSRASVAALRAGSTWARSLAVLWAVGIVGDATTTLLMMGTGRFEEANGAAAGLMGTLGLEVWVLVSSLLCVAIATLSLARPRGTYAGAVAVVAVLVCLGKLHATVGNALLWWTTSR
jgi:hypothetical protein